MIKVHLKELMCDQSGHGVNMFIGCAEESESWMTCAQLQRSSTSEVKWSEVKL